MRMLSHKIVSGTQFSTEVFFFLIVVHSVYKDELEYTVSWRIRIFNCIEEVPRFFFSIEFNPTFPISNYLPFNCTPYTF
jgi:hypothetical protein